MWSIRVVDGGGTYSIITLVNVDTSAAPYTLSFYADNGTALTLNTTAGTNAVFSGVIPVGGSTIIRTNDLGSTILQGYAVLNTSSASYDYDVAGSVVFGLALPNTILLDKTLTFEASCPLDTGLDYTIAFPFDATTAVTGLAIANSYGDSAYQTAGGETANLAIAFYDQSGNNFYSTTLQLPYGQHTAFMLSTYPQTANKTGMMVISSTDPFGNPYAVKTLGLRVNSANTTFTSITPVIPCEYSSYYGCTN
jgi:hypothetical protein